MATKTFGKKLGWVCGFYALLFALMFFSGCQSQSPEAINAALAKESATPVETSDDHGDIIHVGDPLTITFSDTPPPGLLPFEERVKDDGKITLIFDKTFVAAGKTRGALEREIRTNYVPSHFLNLTVTIKAQARFYYVYGEVNHPGEYEYKGNTTVTKAIASAGGFNNFAQTKKVRVTHNGKVEIVNCKKVLQHPESNLPVRPGDEINVPRRW